VLNHLKAWQKLGFLNVLYLEPSIWQLIYWGDGLFEKRSEDSHRLIRSSLLTDVGRLKHTQ